jgi:hypothetical protein
MRWIGFPETSVQNSHSMLRNIPEERRSHLNRGGNLKSRDLILVYMHICKSLCNTASNSAIVQSNVRESSEYWMGRNVKELTCKILLERLKKTTKYRSLQTVTWLKCEIRSGIISQSWPRQKSFLILWKSFFDHRIILCYAFICLTHDINVFKYITNKQNAKMSLYVLSYTTKLSFTSIIQGWW